MTKFIFANLVLRWYLHNEMELAIIYGGRGKGKTTYACKVGVDVLQTLNPEMTETEAWEIVFENLVFKPIDFWQKIWGLHGRIPLLIWDDAGLWLNALKWQDSFIQSVQEWLNVARTDMACLMLTSPTVGMVMSKIRESDTLYTIHVRPDRSTHGSIKTMADGTEKDYKYREARLYTKYQLPDLTWSLPSSRGYDRFSALMPDWFFQKYDPIRQKYSKIAKEIMGFRLMLRENRKQYKYATEEQQKTINDNIRIMEERLYKLMDIAKLLEFVDVTGTVEGPP